jgi:hypothetical protein
MARFKRLPSGKISYLGETFPGFNKPKKAPSGSKKKFFGILDLDITAIQLKIS